MSARPVGATSAGGGDGMPSLTTITPGNDRRAVLRLLGWLWVALAVYGSLLPFEWRNIEPPPRPGPVAWVDHALRQTALSWGPRCQVPRSYLDANSSPGSDLWVNLLLYVPAAMLLRLAARRPGRGTMSQWARSLLPVLAVAYLVESLQNLTPDRIGTWEDFLRNSGGASAAWMLAPWVGRTVRRVLFWCHVRAAPLRYGWTWCVTRWRGHPALVMAVTGLNVAVVGVMLLVAWTGGGAGIAAAHGSGTTGSAPGDPARSEPMVALGPVRPGAWWLEDAGIGGVGSPPRRPMNWLPFARDLSRPYDQTFERLGPTLILYGLIAGLVSLQLLGSGQRWGLGSVLLAVGIVAVLREAAEVAGAGVRADITELVLAIAAVGMLAAAVWLWTAAVAMSCRRRRRVPVAVERRRA